MDGINFLKKHAAFAVCLLLCIATIIPYWQVRNYPYVDYDDDVYVTTNPQVQAGLTAKSVAWSFSMTGYASNWHPLTWISHMLDIELFGLKAGPHHLTSLFLHIANTLLLFLVLRAMTGELWKSGFVAALFALHPMHVESVAWISERKDVLSGLFWILTLWCYLGYARHRGSARYALVVLVFSLGLLAKPMLVTLPFVLLLIDFWPLKRIDFAARTDKNAGRKSGGVNRSAKPAGQAAPQFAPSSVTLLILEKLPLFFLAVASCVVTFMVQRKGGAVEPLESLPVAVRIANGVVSYGVYIWKMILPYDLACLYPHPYEIMWTKVVFSLLFLGIATFLSLKTMRRMPYMTVGWFWYLGTLVPVIGFVQVGLQAMADRYTYIPFIGLFIMIAWGAPEVLPRLRHRKEILSTAAAAVMLVLMMATKAQVGYWRGSIALFEHAIAVTENHDIARNNLGVKPREQGKTKQAIIHYFASVYNNLGFSLAQQGKTEEAISQYKQALRIDPTHIRALNNLEMALAKLGRVSEAIDYYSETLSINPDNFDAHCNVGDILLEQGKTEEAILHFKEALRINPHSFPTHNTLGVTLAQQGRIDEASGHFMEALRIKPDDVGALNNLGHALVEQGRLDDAISQFNAALRIKPDDVETLCNLGIAFAKQGRMDDAVAQFKEALRIKPDCGPAQQNLVVVLKKMRLQK